MADTASSEPLVLNPKLTAGGLAIAPSADLPGVKIVLTDIAIGTGLYEPTGQEKALRAEVARYRITSGSVLPNGQVQVGTTIKDTDNNGNTPNGKDIGELGWFSGNTLIAVWSRGTGGALFRKAVGFDVPFAYTLDVSALPAGSVTITTTTDPDGMAALILKHEAKRDPHPQYARLDGATFTGATKGATLGFGTSSKDFATTEYVRQNALPLQPALGSYVDLNTVKDSGIYHQPLNVQAASGTNYPVPLAGKLEVYSSGVMVYQTYQLYNASDSWIRTYYSGAWSRWRQVAFLDAPAFTASPTAPTPTAGDKSTRLATTEFVMSAIGTASIGSIVWEPRTSTRAGFLKANGAVVSRTDYPLLWAYAQASGALVADASWPSRPGCFSSGDGASTFRIPELRGDFIRCWDDSKGVDSGRAIGSWQDSANRSHAHGASSAAVGDHAHSAWTDGQGWHGHGVTDPQHSHPAIDISSSGRGPYFGNGTQEFSGGGNTRLGVGGSAFPTYSSPTRISINADGTHGHNVGVGGAGAHAHGITVNADGGAEARPRNTSLLALIRAY
ncbi:hypothetical protein [Paraburkholderia sp. J10-1]|uniref:hypothetical protein n=1 Tax=Paraburkholderia sp. J10-1 TaxID=2805430 RepID=UPI002AB74AC5|nr:hypothetical protein [Paraburkholderia sp. J10-1]